MNSVDYPDDSDSSDEDYIPENKQTEVLSEVDSDGDEEDPLSDKEELGTCRSKRKKKSSKSRKRMKQGILDDKDSIQNMPEKTEISEEVRKKQEDDLWASFKRETNFKAKPTNLQSLKTKDTKENDHSEPKSIPDKVKVTQIFEFAGEEVKVEKEVPINSTEARLLNKASGSDPPKRGRGKASGGIGSFLSQLGRKQKITTLEKSKLDWDKFKKEENLEDELHNFNKGKDGYLERQDFLQRTDIRRFEIEKEIRSIERNRRMNNL